MAVLASEKCRWLKEYFPAFQTRKKRQVMDTDPFADDLVFKFTEWDWPLAISRSSNNLGTSRDLLAFSGYVMSNVVARLFTCKYSFQFSARVRQVEE